MGRVTIGVDIGQKVDPTAIAVVEAEVRGDRHHYSVRLLERMKLGTPYPDVARRLADLYQSVIDQTGERPLMFIDATGVGKPVVDMVRAAGVRRVRPRYFTFGDRHVGESLGKAYLVSRMQSLMQSGRLHLPPSHRDAAVMRKELLNYEIKVTEDANDKYGAFRVGTHDDMVTAVGLAVHERDGQGSGFATWKPRER